MILTLLFNMRVFLCLILSSHFYQNRKLSPFQVMCQIKSELIHLTRCVHLLDHVILLHITSLVCWILIDGKNSLIGVVCGFVHTTSNKNLFVKTRPALNNAFMGASISSISLSSVLRRVWPERCSGHSTHPASGEKNKK